MKKNAAFFIVPFILIILLKYFSSDKFSDDYIDNSIVDYEIINVSNVPETIDFNFHVNPILSDKCFACHGPDDKQRKANLRLDTKEGLYQMTEDLIKRVIDLDNLEERTFSKEWWKKELMLEGGAYGHLNHPFDDKKLTFSDFKKLIINTLQGKLDKEGPVTEKTDGQNIMISWKNGKLIAARNKGHIKNFRSEVCPFRYEICKNRRVIKF